MSPQAIGTLEIRDALLISLTVFATLGVFLAVRGWLTIRDERKNIAATVRSVVVLQSIGASEEVVSRYWQEMAESYEDDITGYGKDLPFQMPFNTRDSRDFR